MPVVYMAGNRSFACEYTGHGKICHTVNVFFCCKSILDHCLIQMFRKRTEQKNSMDLVIFVYFIDGCKKLILGDILRKKNFFSHMQHQESHSAL